MTDEKKSPENTELNEEQVDKVAGGTDIGNGYLPNDVYDEYNKTLEELGPVPDDPFANNHGRPWQSSSRNNDRAAIFAYKKT